jgi:hypothetical protein
MKKPAKPLKKEAAKKPKLLGKPKAKARGTLKIKAKPAAKAAAKGHHLVLCEPYSLNVWAIEHAPGLGSVKLTVNSAMYALLKEKPTSFLGDDGQSNAYRFGPAFPIEEYEYVGGHMNDGAQTGFVDVDLIDESRSMQDIVNDEFEKCDFDWNNRAALRRVVKKAPEVLFIGETMGGDVGASLHVHRKGREIDGIIVDNKHFFPG